MDKEQLSELNRQEYFILRIRDCADRLRVIHEREDILAEAAHVFSEFAGASDALIIDLSRETLDLYRSSDAEGARKDGVTTVILEESVVPLLELLRDRYMCELGIRIFNKKIVTPPEGICEDILSLALDEIGVDQGFVLPLTVSRKFGTENVQGILLINNVPSYRFADPGHLALLRMAADLLSVTADNHDLGNALSRLRPTDQVTGLASRSRLLSQLVQEVERANYFDRSFALVMANIDHLKSLNEKKGHLYGDLAIKSVADDLLLEARSIDLVCRWNAEQYLVLMPEAGLAEAQEFAERCRVKISAHALIPDDYHQETFITTSLGVVLYPEHGLNHDLLLRNVELSLLQAQLNGRNQVAVWSTQWLAESQDGSAEPTEP